MFKNKKIMLAKIIIRISLLFLSLLMSPAMSAATTNTQPISLNFQDIKVRAVLQILGEFSGLNLIVSDKVQGSMSVHLNNVSWQQALDIVLQAQGLGKHQYGDVVLIAPHDEIAVRAKQQIQSMQQLEELTPLRSELITISYGKAADIANLLKARNNSLLSKRGNVSVDVRTNTLWVQDIAEKLVNVRAAIKKLDMPVRQVLIEARIVNMDSSFAEELGVRFGVTHPNHVSGTIEGAGEIGAASIDRRLNVDLPAANFGKAGGAASVGMALVKLGKNTLLDLELSAMESEGNGQIISRPKLITADQQPALIEAGEEIPYQQETSGGSTNVTFKKAVLSLNVTPQIIPDGKVLLFLKVNQDKTNARLVQGVPSIDTREIQTQVLVNDGETIVLGGIYEESQQKQVQRVPFFGSLPVVGALFRNNKTSNSRKELLIFVTPHILS